MNSQTLTKRAMRDTSNPAMLAQMAKDLIDGKVQDDNGSITEVLLLNDHLPIEVLCELARWARSDFGYFAKAICRRPDVPSQLLAECGRSIFSEELCEVAEHPNTNSRTLLRLARVGDHTVVLRALVHPNFPKEMIGRLADCANDFTRMVIAHQTSDQNILTRLSTDRNWAVRQVVVPLAFHEEQHGEPVEAQLKRDLNVYQRNPAGEKRAERRPISNPSPAPPPELHNR
jgi:hypothetical protein